VSYHTQFLLASMQVVVVKAGSVVCTCDGYARVLRSLVGSTVRPVSHKIQVSGMFVKDQFYDERWVSGFCRF